MTKYTVTYGIDGYVTKHTIFFGPYRDAIIEAQERADMEAIKYIREHNIYSNEEQEEVTKNIYYKVIEVKDESLTMFAVSEKDSSDPNIVGIYPTRQEAEEILYTMAEEDIYKLSMTADFDDLGLNPLENNKHYWRLMADYISTYTIIEVSVYGVRYDVA